MTRGTTTTRRRLTAMVAVTALLAAAVLLRHGGVRGADPEAAGKFTEELVHVRAEDDIPNGGAIFAPPKDSAKPVAVIWLHGWGANFYYPTYVKIGRALAGRGYACITANTRMHDVGTLMGQRGGKRVRGGGYWGVPSEAVRDLAAWIDFAQGRGFKGVVLVGHSAGWDAVRAYQADKQDRRVVGLVFASGGFRPRGEKPNPDLLAQATRLVTDGHGDDLLRFPNPRFPSFMSAATFLDDAKTPPELTDFFGIRTPNPAVTRIRCPILAWFGTKGDGGTAEDLELIKSSVKRQSSGPSRMDTVMIQNADHMYTGEEAQVAQTIAQWAVTLGPPKAADGDARHNR